LPTTGHGCDTTTLLDLTPEVSTVAANEAMPAGSSSREPNEGSTDFQWDTHQDQAGPEALLNLQYDAPTSAVPISTTCAKDETKANVAAEATEPQAAQLATASDLLPEFSTLSNQMPPSMSEPLQPNVQGEVKSIPAQDDLLSLGMPTLTETEISMSMA